MVITAAKGCPYRPHDAQRAPVEAYLRERRSHHASNEDEVLAVLRAEQLCGATKLTNCDPVMTKAFRSLGIAKPLQREDDGFETACLNGFSDCKRHGAAAGDQTNR